MIFLLKRPTAAAEAALLPLFILLLVLLLQLIKITARKRIEGCVFPNAVYSCRVCSNQALCHNLKSREFELLSDT